MKQARLYFTLFILILLGSFLLYFSYSAVKNETIEQLNNQQTVLAKAAARSIEGYFDHYTRLLNTLSKLDAIVEADEYGKRLMEIFYQCHAGEILAITRVNAGGHVMHTIPPDPRVDKANVSGREDFQRITQTHLPAVSDVFLSVRGLMAVALCVPVFRHDAFDGAIIILFPFDNLARTYLEGIKLSEDAYAWMIDRKGVELYCPVPGHVGKTVFENCKDFPSILAMARDMIQGKEGQTAYVFNKVRGQTIKSGKKLAVYVPVRLPDNFWSIVIATPESDVVGIIHGFRSWWLLIAGLMFVSAALFLSRSLTIAREESKRRGIELALQQSERKYRQLVELAQEGIWVIDTGGDTTFVNPRMAEMLGYTIQEMLGRPLRFFMGTQSADIVMPLVELCKQGVVEEHDFEFTRKDGESIHAHIAVCPIIDNGDYTGALAVVVDITKRKGAEEALMESQQRLADIIDFLPDPTFVIDTQGNVIAWNRAIVEMMGISKEEMLGKGGYEYAVPFHGARRPILIDLVLDPSPEIEAKYLTIERKGGVLAGLSYIPDIKGREAYFSETAGALYDSRGNVVGAIESVRDVTRQRYAEEALMESQQRLADIIDFLPDATFVLDREGRIITWNRAMEEMTGVSKQVMIGKGDHACTVPFYGYGRPHLLDLIDARDGEIESRYEDVRRKGDILYAETHVPCLYGGKGAYVFSTGAPLFDAHGNRVGAIESIRDITEQRLAQEALKRSEEKYRELVENANSIILRMDNLGNVTFINEFALRFFGYSEEEILGMNVSETIMPPVETGGRGLQSTIEDIALNPDLYVNTINENTCRTGQKVWVAWTNKPIRDEHGQVVEVLCVGNDITERKHAEEALKRANILLFTQKETSIDGILAVDENDVIISSNQRFTDMWGLSAELLARHEDTLVLEAIAEKVVDPSSFLQRVRYLYAHRNETSLEELALKDGRTFERYSAPMNASDGRCYGRVWYFRDITERKLMEEAVARAEEKYRDIFENSITGIYQVTPEGGFLSLNKSIAGMLGYNSPEELIEEVGSVWRLYVHPERRVELHRLLREHGSVREFEVEFFRKDRNIVWVSLNVRCLRNLAGDIVQIEGTLSDVTDRKILRARLDQAQKMEAIGTLAGGIAHDFNNILTPIIGYTELSLNVIPEGDRLGDHMRQVLLSANRAKDLVRQILTFSRKTEQEKKPVQLSVIVKEVLKLLRSSLPATIDIRQSIHGDAVDSTTMADPTRIHQVLMNLCTNAAHAMRSRGGTLTVTLENVEIEPHTEGGTPDVEAGPYLRLSVADTGEGMDETVRRRIFDPYFTTKGPNEGTGLGLAVVYGIVKALSGGVAVSSESGKGSSFFVYFPRIVTISAAAAPLPRPLPTGHGTILVVDDERSIVDMVEEMLDALGYQAVSRYSSIDALEVFRARPESFDLVIADMTMPNMTGIDLAKEIFRIRPHVPLIICTGFSEKVDENEMKLLGIKALLMKPVSMHEMAVAVNGILAGERQGETTLNVREMVG
jgi:PAS domain S-box-containing protein